MFSSARPQVSHSTQHIVQQVRHATLLRRPKRPYTFTQLITLSDGSTFLHRTTSPQSVYQTTKDTKNHILWNPSSQKLLGVEEDEAGRLKRFRDRFGRGFDIDAQSDEGSEREVNEASADEQPGKADRDGGLLDLISASSKQEAKKGKAAEVVGQKERSGKGKGGER